MSSRDSNTIKAQVCKECGKPIRYVIRTSKKVNGGRFRVEYLRCPLCGARATRRVAVEITQK